MYILYECQQCRSLPSCFSPHRRLLLTWSATGCRTRPARTAPSVVQSSAGSWGGTTAAYVVGYSVTRAVVWPSRETFYVTTYRYVRQAQGSHSRVVEWCSAALKMPSCVWCVFFWSHKYPLMFEHVTAQFLASDSPESGHHVYNQLAFIMNEGSGMVVLNLRK